MSFTFNLKNINDAYRPYADNYNKLYNLEEETRNKIERMRGLKNWRKEYDKLFEKYGGNIPEEETDKLVDKYYKSFKMSQYIEKTKPVELATLEITYEDLSKKASKTYKEACKIVFGLNPRNCCVKQVSKKKTNSLTNSQCCICFETHSLSNICVSNCGHLFGKRCAIEMMENYQSQNREISCPICRSDNLQFTIFKNRKSKISKK